MGCAASAEGAPPSTTLGQRADEANDKRGDTRKDGDGGATQGHTNATDENEKTQNGAVSTTKGPPDGTVSSPTTLPPVTNTIPATIAGYPVNTYTDGSTRVAVKCVILSRQKCESICRFLDAVRKSRERNGGYFRNPEEPVEAEARRDVDTASAASGRSKVEPSVVAFHNSSVTGHGMNVSMAVHVGQAHGPADALSPSPNGGLAHTHAEATGTPGRSNLNHTNNTSTPAAQRTGAQSQPIASSTSKVKDGAQGANNPQTVVQTNTSDVPATTDVNLKPSSSAPPPSATPIVAAQQKEPTSVQSKLNNDANTNSTQLVDGTIQRQPARKTDTSATANPAGSERQEGGEPIPGSVEVDGAL